MSYNSIDLSTIKIPRRMRSRPMFMGMAVPYTTYIDPKTGVPDFKINEEGARRRCIFFSLCAMCGHSLGRNIAFIGGPGSIEQGQLFVDAGMHVECARYAWQVCPYIVYGKGHAQFRQDHGGIVVEFREIPTEAPERMGMIITRGGYRVVIRQEDGMPFVRAGTPESVEWRTYTK